MSLTWESVLELARTGDEAAVAAMLIDATEEERLAFAGAVEAGLKAMQPDDWWRKTRDPSGSIALAVVGTAPSAAKASALLGRRTMLDKWGRFPVPLITGVLRARDLPWIGDLGQRLGARLTAQDAWTGGWGFVAAVLAESGGTPPVTEGVVRGWLLEIQQWDEKRPYLERLRESPYLDRFLPAVFEFDGLGGDLHTAIWDQTEKRWSSQPAFPTAVATLVAEGRLERKTILELTVDRLARGDRPAFLRQFAMLHDLLAPDAEETAGHTAAYARLLPDAPSSVAGLAQRALRAVHDAGLLEFDMLLEASRPTLVRKEKTLVKAQLSWLDRVARDNPGRVGEVLETMAVAFDHPALDIQERALTLIERRAASADAATLARLATMTGGLGGDLPARAARLFGPSASLAGVAAPPVGLGSPPVGLGSPPGGLGSPPGGLDSPLAGPGSLVAASSSVDAGLLPAGSSAAALPLGASSAALPPGASSAAGVLDAGVPLGGLSGAGSPVGGPVAAGVPGAGSLGVAGLPPPAGPAEMPAAIGSTAELAEEIVAVLRDETAVRWERILAGLVTLRTADDKSAVQHVLDQHAAAFGDERWRRLHFRLGAAMRAFLKPVVPRARWEDLKAAVRSRLAGEQRPVLDTPDRLLTLRVTELAVLLAKSPVTELLATPTHVNGSLDPAVLAERLRRAEAAGEQPWALDFEQALLRLPRGTGPDVAAGLTSAAGRWLATWLAEGGLPDPVSTRVDQPVGGSPAANSGPSDEVFRVLVDLAPARPARLSVEDQLFTLARGTKANSHTYWNADETLLAATLPHHREVSAAWALPDLAMMALVDQRGGSKLLPLLAECDGPIGPAMSLGLAYALTARHEPDRVAAVDAFLALAAGGEPFAAAAGHDLGDLAARGLVKLGRAVAPLTDAHRAGASAAVWELLLAALPVLLPSAARGLPETLELASQIAALTGARDDVPGLSELADRKGSSRLLKEARRLRSVLTAQL